MSDVARSLHCFPRVATILAWHNLVDDRVRLTVTLVGIIFAVVLMNTEFGLFLGFAETTSSLIDNSDADLWIMAPGTRNVDQVSAISERKLYQALATPGVAKAARLNVEFADFSKPGGGTESVLVIGFDPDRGLGQPWNIVAGSVSDLRYPDTIMVDELYRAKLGIDHIGQVVEISGHRAQVVGFTRGIRSFTQSPYVFTSFRSSLSYSRIRSNETKYVLIAVAKGGDRDTVRAALTRRIPDVEIRTTNEFSRLTEVYWMLTTGAGLALLVGTVMGFIVGVVVVSQTLYATTVDHIREFGTLRAIGGSTRYIYSVIVRQALLSAVAGYVIGLTFTFAIETAARSEGPAILIPLWFAGVMFVVTVAMCVAAAIISIAKVTRLDPSTVFK